MRIANLIAVGIPVKHAHAVGGTVNTAVTAAGSSRTDATALTADINLVTTCNEGEGVILPAGTFGDVILVGNGTDVNALVYPPTGGKLNNKPANVPLLLPDWGGAAFFALNSTSDYLVIY